MTSNVDHHHNDDHLRYLLDQRAARADLHARFPSQSDISDSPSLYSHGPFSPHPHDTHNTPSTSFHYTLSVHDNPDPQDPPVSDRERLNYPDASTLDLESEPRSSYDQQSIRTSSQGFHDSGSDDDPDGDDADRTEEEHRVSTYGPKMTVHSRAPWELGEEDELPRKSKKKGDKNMKPNDAGKRAWGLSARPSIEHRPSVDSNRSLSRSKQSFDTMSSLSSSSGSGGAGGGALFALAQASFSSTSVAINPSPQSSLRDKLSIPRLRSRTASSVKSARLDSLDTRSIAPSIYSVSAQTSPASYTRATSPVGSFVSHADPRVFTSSPEPHTPDRSQEYRHPYANPEFARPSPSQPYPNQTQNLEELHNLANSSSYASSLGPSESNVTLTESSSNISQAHSGSTISLTPVPSPQPGKIRNHGPINKAAIRTVSHNGAVDNAPLPVTPASAMPGWSDTASSIKLISLEEAQAQARERSRSGTTSSAVASPTTGRFNDLEPLPSPTSQIWSTRIRSHSTNSTKVGRAQVVDVNRTPPPVPAIPPEQAAPQRTVVRKKSGFMRLFNGKERASPPPVPSWSNASLPSPSSVTSVPPSTRRTPQRVPVPQMSPTMDASESVDTHHPRGDWEYNGDSNLSQATVREQLSSRRNVPGLSIVTSSSSPGDLHTRPRGRSISPSASDATHMGSTLTPTTATDSFVDGSLPPSSAPPTSADFLGVNIRPVSTMFSHDFAGHLVRTSSDQSRPSLDMDSGTPTTSSGISPLSPGFSVNLDGRPGDDKAMIGIASPQDDQSAVIQALQEQIMVARRAWQRQIWELEGQVRDLKAEVEEFRAAEHSRDYCSACGRGSVGRPSPDSEVDMDDLKKAGVKVSGVVNRPRARTGVGSRFASGT
ncbi:hypothetical protein EIP91_005549 [Steccherinum ochraceum]|uniref:Uncharacterized protein n=1 Tax=Steccherinum ochraceum TaxID=92696 RepID=A0A4R0RMG5_9APHY|nr:hypothetical protein EIP91_005549 [Steccherinum ochraceum]